MSDRDRNYSERDRPHVVPGAVQMDRIVARAMKYVAKARSNLGLTCLSQKLSDDEFGPRIDVYFAPDRVIEGTCLLANIGRSYGPVRIFIREAQ